MTTFGITGHQHAPLEVWHSLENELVAAFSRANPLVGVSSLAAGADQEFASAVLRAGGSLYAVLPGQNYESSFETDQDRSRFVQLLSLTARIEILNFTEPSEEAYLQAGKRVVNLCDVLIAVWDGLPTRGKGGTADVVRYAKTIGIPVKIIWPSGVRR